MFAVVMAHDICIPVSTCNILSYSGTARDTVEELPGQCAFGRPYWWHDRSKSCRLLGILVLRNYWGVCKINNQKAGWMRTRILSTRCFLQFPQVLPSAAVQLKGDEMLFQEWEKFKDRDSLLMWKWLSSYIDLNICSQFWLMF